MPPARTLHVNADDFGFTRDVNAGIVDAHQRGILTSTTLMANGDAFDDAVRLARATPSLDIGVHFVLVQGRSLVSGAELPRTVAGLIQALALRRIDPYRELRAQIARIVDAGLAPTHLDTHKHTHLLPPVLDAVARLGEEFNVRWIRRPMDLPLTGPPSQAPLATRLAGNAFSLLRSHFHTRLARRGLRTTDHFAGFRMTGRYSAEDLLALIPQLPPGSTEFMTHPGHCTAELLAAPTRLKQSRRAELDALTDARVLAALAAHGVTLAPFPR